MSTIGKKLASGSALQVFTFLATVLVTFFMMPFVIHALGDRMYGFWTLVGTFIGYYGLFDFGLGSAVSRHIAGAIGQKDMAECNRVFSTAIIIYSCLGILVFVVTCIIAGIANVIVENPEDAALFWKVILILGSSVAISFPLRSFGGVLTAQLRYDIQSYIGLFSLFLRTVLIVLALISGLKILAMAWVMFFVNILALLLTAYFAKSSLPSLQLNRHLAERGTAKTLFSYGFFTFIAQIADSLRFNIDNIVVSAYIDLSAVTHYSIVGALVHYYKNLMISFVGVFQPLFSRQHDAGEIDSVKKTFFFATKISVYASSFVGFGLIAWGKPFIQRWMGSEYLDAYPCLVVLAAGYVVALSQTPSVGLLYGTSKHKFYALFNTIEGVCNLVLSIFLARHYGLIGIAMGTLIPMLILKAIVQPIYVCRVSKIPYHDYMLRIGKAFGVVILSLAVPIYFSLKYALASYDILIILGIGSVVCYFPLIWFLGFSFNEKQIFRLAIFPTHSS